MPDRLPAIAMLAVACAALAMPCIGGAQQAEPGTAPAAPAAPPAPAAQAASAAPAAPSRTIYRCTRDSTVSLSTAPEPGSKCVAKQVQDSPGKVTNLWGSMGVVSGTLYAREQDGATVYGTRKLPGATVFLKFTVETPPGEPAHPGMGQVGKPQLKPYAQEFKAAAKKTGVDDAWLRAIAHAESNFDAAAVSPKGAQGVMQLMPDVAKEYGVADPFSARDNIQAGARHMQLLLRRYGNDRTLAAAAYNAGIGTVTRYKGVPPYAETQAYIDKVQALYARYREAMGFKTETAAQ